MSSDHALAAEPARRQPAAPMLISLRRWSYRLSAVLAVAYVGYVLWLKFSGRVMGGPLGDLGEFLLVLASVTALAIGLFADEAQRRRDSP